MARYLIIASAILALAGVLCAAGPGAKALSIANSETVIHVCAAPSPGYASCDALMAPGAAAQAQIGNPPPGFSPAKLLSAYALTIASARSGVGVTVAVIDAYDDPAALSDVNTYRREFDIPPLRTCQLMAVRNSRIACFAKADENGRTRYPPRNSRWDNEISLDLDMVSAVCPLCNILLVEASNESEVNLGKSVNTAVRLGANVINNSYSSAETLSQRRLDVFYNHPGVAITAASGDLGYGPQYPASSPYVTAVGGTILSPSATTARGWTERAWPDGGSGCSAYEPKPAWQSDTGCTMRTTVDVAADAAPLTGVAVYDSIPCTGQSGWLVLGGTSVASAIIAGVYALAGNARQVVYGSYPYLHPSALFNVSAGRNGSCGTYLCTAGPGYNGPTGMGTPDGTDGF